MLPTDVLIVSPSAARRARFLSLLQAGGYAASAVESMVEAALSAQNGLEAGVALIDYGVQADQQFLTAKRLKEIIPPLQVVLLSEQAKVDTALRATNEGIFWLLPEPFENEELLYLITRGLVVHQLAKENIALREAMRPPLTSERLVAQSEPMQRLLTRIQRIAALDASVLITGESGTGKTLIASIIHRNSTKRSGPFIALSCANFPRDLLESELFGHEKGAFTGATTARPGSIELCHGGTLFLDEIGELPLELQPKLLTFLQDKQIRRLGGRGAKTVDVRIVCATNRDLDTAVKAGDFREDLFYRVNVLNLCIPPLRERTQDIEPLAHQILKGIAERRGRKVSWSLSRGAKDALEHYNWPGNVRELEHALERATAFCDSDEIQAADIDVFKAVRHVEGAASLVGMTLHEMENYLIKETLKRCNGDKEEAAKILGVSLKTIYNRIKSLETGKL